MRYQFRILQTGSLPLRPDGRRQPGPHRCTSALVWPADEPPSPDNAVLTDPCFDRRGYAEACGVLGELGVSLAALRYVFLTHSHFDHLMSLPADAPRPAVDWAADVARGLPGFEAVPCPGHSDDSTALAFRDGSGRSVWVVGDAVLDREWLLAWRYYWPNGYSPEEVVQTWRSVADVLQADLIVPGHGEPIEVTPGLCEELAGSFDRAEHARRCGDVLERIRRRFG
jgi:glyoxylase-like metal-dependent hydrolase (beta-lactamase superfamily II)